MEETVAKLRNIAEQREKLQSEYRANLAALAANLAALAEQEQALLQKLEDEQSRPTPPAFEAKKRTVQWNDGCQKLSQQRFKLLDALYFAENRELALNDLEAAVWGDEVDVNLGTIKTAMCRLGIALTDANSPFLIESVLSKGGETMEISDRKGVRMVKTRPALVGYRLVLRVTESEQALQNSP